MAKAKNRDKRKKAAVKKANQVKNGSGLMDMSKTYIIVRAQKDMTKFPKEIDIEAIKAEQQKQAPVMGVAQPFDYNYLFEEFVKEAKA